MHLANFDSAGRTKTFGIIANYFAAYGLDNNHHPRCSPHGSHECCGILPADHCNMTIDGEPDINITTHGYNHSDLITPLDAEKHKDTEPRKENFATEPNITHYDHKRKATVAPPINVDEKDDNGHAPNHTHLPTSGENHVEHPDETVLCLSHLMGTDANIDDKTSISLIRMCDTDTLMCCGEINVCRASAVRST